MILLTIAVLLFAAFLELNKNTLSGWLLFAASLVLYILLRRKKLLHVLRLYRFAAFLALFAVWALIAFISYPPVKSIPASALAGRELTAPVATANGLIAGTYSEDHTVEIYTGIPYARPPVGELRWRPPVEPDSWEGVRECTYFAPMSMQGTNSPVFDSLTQIIGYHDYCISLRDNSIPPVSEDSLYLNVWKPAGTQEGLPVLVYIHGGSLKTGQPWFRDYSGEQFARDGVVTVNMGYRLGVFGFYADEELLAADGTTGNYGLLDQIMALHWVQDNIAAFGGDPGNVTIIGESAGSVCVDALCVSPLAKGLFWRAILESSTLACVEPPYSYRSLPEAIASGNALKQRYSCSSTEDLRHIPAERLVGEMDTQHHLTPDGYVLPDDPYQLRMQGIHNEEALLHGYNSEESGPFIIFDHAKLSDYESRIRAFFGPYAEEVLALYPASDDEEADRYWAGIYGAVFFDYPHYCLNRLAAAKGIPVWEYWFTKDNGRLGAWHSGEMIYTFGMIPDGSRLFDESDRTLSDTMHRYWVSFAENGDPNSAGLPLFEENTGSDTIMLFGNETGMTAENSHALYSILDKMQNWQDP